MVIGIDAGALSTRDERLQVGVYRVITHLLWELGKLDTKNEYRLYSFAPVAEPVMKGCSERMQNLVIPPSKGWFSWRLPASLIIHPIDLFLGVSQAIPFAAGKSIGFIYDLGFLHHPAAYPKSQKRLASQTNALVRRAKHVITISYASKADICHTYNLPEEKVTVAYPGIDERFTQSGETFTGNKPYFLHVGSLKPGKNIPTIIKAFAEFRKKTKTEYLLLIIGGDYWLDTEILKTITDCEMDESVRILGHVPDEILPQYYRGASAFVTASLWEGFCLPVLEAMACGIPVIASNTGALPEVVPEAELLTTPEDVPGFAAFMERIVNNKELRDRVIAKGLAKSQSFQWNTFAQTVLSVIEASAT